MGDRAAGSGGGGGGGSGVRRVGDYVLVRQIGSGAYARVWLGKHRTRGTEVALKEIAVERLSSKLRESLLSEVDILRRIRHPNVIALHESIRDGGKIYLVLEYCRGGDLHSYLQQHKRVSETVAKHFIQQLGKHFLRPSMLRENNVVHRDLKPQNILLVANNENSLLKIADFGFAKFLEPSSLAETLCGSPLYMAPEVMQAQKYDAKVRAFFCFLVSFIMYFYLFLTRASCPISDRTGRFVECWYNSISTCYRISSFYRG
uniref:Protein kinase domain-containing protein n=1 Tax=Oryza rufipogon TaxID=4529 RepID=A0A0E0NSZ7_ORYRU